MRRSLMILLAVAFGTGTLVAGEPPAVVAQHGGVLLETPAGRFEVVYEAEEGSLVLHALNAAGEERALTKAPALILEGSAGPRTLMLTPVGTTDTTWKVTDASLRGQHVVCRLRVEHDGEPLTIELCAFLRPHEGLLLLGGDTLRLVVTAPAGASHLAIRPFTTEDVALLGAAAPEVILEDEGREIPLSLTRGSSVEPVWLLSDASVLRNGSRVFVRAQVGDRTLQTPIQLPTRPDEGLRGGTVVPVGAGGMRLEFVREPSAGRLCVFVVAPPQGLGAQVEGLPQLVLGSESTKVIPAVAVRDAPDAWVIEHEALKGTSIRGSLRLKFGGKAYEVALPAAPSAAQAASQAPRPVQPAQPKGAPSAAR
jgi:hypothetical protein